MSKKIISNGQAVLFNISLNYEQYILEKGAAMSVADGIVVETGTCAGIVAVNATLTVAKHAIMFHFV